MKRGLGLALMLTAACGGQVEHEPEAMHCHSVHGYFSDNRCSQRVTFDSCQPPEYVWTVRDFQCVQVEPLSPGAK